MLTALKFHNQYRNGVKWTFLEIFASGADETALNRFHGNGVFTIPGFPFYCLVRPLTGNTRFPGSASTAPGPQKL